jgi:hypothetical protein
VTEPPIVACVALPGTTACEAAAAAVGVKLAAAGDGATLAGGDGAAIVGVVGAKTRRGPTMLAADAARRLEVELREGGFDASARGRLAWVAIEGGEGWIERAAAVAAVARSGGTPALLVLPPELWSEAIAAESLGVAAALLRADLPAQRALCALVVGEARARGVRVKVLGRAPGRVGARRALAGVDPGGEAGGRAARVARALAAAGPPRRAGRATEAGQALPLVLGAALLLCFVSLLLAALGGAVTGKSRAQRVADLAALSAARSMRDDFDRLFTPARLRGGAPNPAHLSRAEYLARARATAIRAARKNDADPRRLAVRFPDGDSFAPLRVRVDLRAAIDLPEAAAPGRTDAWALAEAIPTTSAAAPAPPGAAAMATGGGYSGPLAYRQGKPMRPDVAAAFDRMAAAARAAGLALAVNSAFRSDAEQAALWAANPDPRWVAPPGTSLHRCGTELDLGPPAAYGWLAANARRFGFLQRYSWEAWHFGFVDGPAPCSDAGDRVGAGGAVAAGGDGESAATALPDYVPARFRDAIVSAAGRWNVAAGLLAAQLMAESNFNPFAVSPAGAAGIAQFMPGTAAAYGLGDPFDAVAAIDAQAHLMSDLLAQFDGRTELALAAYNAGPAPVEECGCVPAYPETQAYVARILGLMDGAGEAPAPVLEVRLVR